MPPTSSAASPIPPAQSLPPTLPQSISPSTPPVDANQQQLTPPKEQEADQTANLMPTPTEPPASSTTPTTPPEAENPAGLPQEKDKPLVIRGFDNSVIRNLNRRLEDPDWQKRAEAANDFSMILGANPNLERRPAYKPYVDAFMLKILRDTSTVVHEPALRAIQVGYYRHPTTAVIEELNVLKTGIGLFGLEPQMVTDALYALYAYQQQEQEEAQHKKADSNKPQTQLVT